MSLDRKEQVLPICSCVGKKLSIHFVHPNLSQGKWKCLTLSSWSCDELWVVHNLFFDLHTLQKMTLSRCRIHCDLANSLDLRVCIAEPDGRFTYCCEVTNDVRDLTPVQARVHAGLTSGPTTFANTKNPQQQVADWKDFPVIIRVIDSIIDGDLRNLRCLTAIIAFPRPRSF